MSASENRRIVRSLIEAALEDDVPKIDALVSDPVLADCIREASRESRRLLPEQKFVIESMIAEGDQVAVQWIITGTYLKGIPGVLGPKRLEVHGSYVATVERGRVSSLTQYSDQLDLLAQLGSRAIFFTAFRTLFRRLTRRDGRQREVGKMTPQGSGQSPQPSAELVNL